MSTAMTVELSGGSHEAFKAALHGIEGIGGFALAWFFKRDAGYVSLTSNCQKERVVAMAKQYGFAVVIAGVVH
jgi:hypothetical protein